MDSLVKEVHVDNGRLVSLAELNDRDELTFSQIADIIEYEPEGLFYD